MNPRTFLPALLLTLALALPWGAAAADNATDNSSCTLSLYPDKITKTASLRFPFRFFVVDAVNDPSFSCPATIDWGAIAISDVLRFCYKDRYIFGFMTVDPNFTPGEYTATVFYGENYGQSGCATFTMKD